MPTEPPREAPRHDVERRWRTVAMAVAVLAVVGTIAWRSGESLTEPVPQAPSLAPAIATTARAESVSQQAAGTTTPLPISVRLQREFVEATDLYAFAENARRRPREGGVFYAEAASAYCRWANERVERQIREAGDAATTEAGPVDARRAAVLDRYARRCAGFRQLDLDAYFRELERIAVDDPLIETGRALSRTARAGDVAGHLAATQGLVDLHDPLLLSGKFVYLMNPDRVAGGPPGGLWFEGHDYRPVVDEYGAYVTALELAGCRSGGPCATDSQRILSCQYRGVCLDSIDADPFANDPAVDPAARQRSWSDVLALAGRIRAALDRGDLDVFRAPASARR